MKDKRVILSFSKQAVFQVITQVLPFSFSLALLFPWKQYWLLTHSHTTQKKAQTVWAFRGTYIHLQSSLYISFPPLKDNSVSMLVWIVGRISVVMDNFLSLGLYHTCTTLQKDICVPQGSVSAIKSLCLQLFPVLLMRYFKKLTQYQ